MPSRKGGLAVIVKLVMLGCFAILCSGCGLSALGYAYNAAYYGVAGAGMMGEYYKPSIELGPGVTKEEIGTINSFAFCYCGGLNKDNSDELNSLSIAFLERLIKELPKDKDGRLATEDELKLHLPAGKNPLELQDYLAAAHALDLKAIIKVSALNYQGSKITDFKMTMWDARTPEKKRLLITTTAAFKRPHTVDEAAISIAKTFFRSSDTKSDDQTPEEKGSNTSAKKS